MRAAKIRQNTLISLFISGISYLHPLLVFAYIARILHPEGMGSIRFASSAAAYFVMFTGLGMPIYGMRVVAGASRDLSRLTAELLMIRVVTGVLSCGAFLLASHWRQGNEVLIIYGMGTLFAIPECTWLYKGKEDYSSLALFFAFTHLAGLAFVFLLVRDASDVKVYAWISVSLPLIMHLIELGYAQRKWKLDLFSQCRKIIRAGELAITVRKHIKPLSLFMLMSCAVTIYSHTDAVMLGLMENDRVVGLYACANRVKSLLPMITTALWAAALPRSAELWKKKNIKGFSTLSEKSFYAVYTLMIPLTVYFMLFAEPWILLLGGEEYMAAAGPLRLLLLAVIPIGFSNIMGGQMLIPAGMERKLFYAEAAGALSNIALNLALIPAFSVSGAAVATTVSETLVSVMAGFFILKAVKVKIFQPVGLAHAAIGSLAAGTIAFALVGLIPELLRGPLSFLVFAAVLCLTMLIVRDTLFLEMYKSLPSGFRKAAGGILQKVRECRFRADERLFPERMRYYCPCCCNRFRSFEEGRYREHPEIYETSRYKHTRQDVICPVCGALPRHRILAQWCEAHRERLLGRDILYFAPEKSMIRWMKRNGISFTTADKYRKADLKVDIQDTALPEQSVDIVICNHVLEHVEDFRAAIREMYRIIRSDGLFICSFPMDPNIDLLDEDPEVRTEGDRIKRFGQRDHLRVFGMHADRFLEEAGFHVEKINGQEYPDQILPVVGPADYDMNRLFCCVRPIV